MELPHFPLEPPSIFNIGFFFHKQRQLPVFSDCAGWMEKFSSPQSLIEQMLREDRETRRQWTKFEERLLLVPQPRQVGKNGGRDYQVEEERSPRSVKKHVLSR